MIPEAEVERLAVGGAHGVADDVRKRRQSVERLDVDLLSELDRVTSTVVCVTAANSPLWECVRQRSGRAVPAAAQGCASVFETHDIEMICPGYDAMLKGRELVKKQFDVLDAVLADLDRSKVQGRCIAQELEEFRRELYERAIRRFPRSHK
jgi:hypothetical protein